MTPDPDERPADAATDEPGVLAAKPTPETVHEHEPTAEPVGPELEGETAETTAAHTVAFPSPIPDYSMEPPRHPDEQLTVALPANPSATAARVPEPPYLAPEPPYLAPESPYLAPESPYLAPEPPLAVASVAAYGAVSMRPRRRPLFGTIIWGVILLALAGYVLLGVLAPAPADLTLWLLGGVILIGLLLIVVGIIAALRRAG